MVFQDGQAWLDPNGAIRAPVVFDNLIQRGEMPVTIGVFIGPGIFRAELPEKLGWAPKPETEILPAVQERYVITEDPNARSGV